MRSISIHAWIKLSLLSAMIALLVAVRPAAPASANFGYVAVAAGDNHSCGLTSAGGVRCWGNNQYGQLGDGTSGAYDYNSPTPGDVVGLTSGVVKIGAGFHFSCALLDTGGLKCWGQNGGGTVGDGTFVDRPTPVDVPGLTSGVVDFAVGSGPHVCALLEDTTLKCWGGNYLGELGNGTADNEDPPNSYNPVPGTVCADALCSGPLTGVIALALGWGDSCVLVEDDVQTPGYGVKCWGGLFDDEAVDPGDPLLCGNLSGFYCETTPKDIIAFGSGVTLLANAEGRRCAAMASGAVTCWGVVQPYNISGLSAGVAKLEGGGDRVCAITNSGALKCWGSPFLGDGTPNLHASPVAVCADAACSGPFTDAVDVSLGSYYHGCAVNAAGFVKCWGHNFRGQLGDGTTTPLSEPRLAPVDLQQDTDGDGCIDIREMQTAPGSETSGGLRNAKIPYDYLNPTHDGQNRVDDILMVIAQYFTDDTDGNPGLPPYSMGYNPDTDRTLVGPNPWNVGPPNGLQRVDDILNQVHQYFHDCS